MGLVHPDQLDEPMSGFRGMFSLLLCFCIEISIKVQTLVGHPRTLVIP